MATERANDLRAFRDFADARLSDGGAEMTLDEALDLWEAENQTGEEREATVQALREALDDMRAGDIGIPAREALSERGRGSPKVLRPPPRPSPTRGEGEI